MGRMDQAEEQYRCALDAAQRLEPLVYHDLSPLRAMLWHVQGELLRTQGYQEEGLHILVSAARLFQMHGDQAGEANALAAAGLSSIPPNAFSGGQKGRQPIIWLETSEETLRVGQTFEVCYSIGQPGPAQHYPPAVGQRLNVLLMAEQADIYPTARSARLDPWARLGPLRFQVTPQQDGPLHIRVLVFSARDGSLLQKTELEPQQVFGVNDGSAA